LHLYLFDKEKNMNFHKWSRIFLLIPLLLSVVHLTPAEATGTTQAANTAKVIWCPSAVTLPKSGKEGCTPAFDMLTGASGLLGYLTAHIPSQAGVVWIGKTYNSLTALDGNILFDGAALRKMAKYSLTIKGGWNGLGKGTLDLNTPSTLDGATFYITGWQGKVTLKNIQVLVRDLSSTTCITVAMCVITTGSIQLDHVEVVGAGSNNSNVEYGAYLANTSSVTSPPSSVTITNTSFLNHGKTGLQVLTKGAVTLKNMSASGNGLSSPGHGASIMNDYDPTASPVIITNGQFNGNGLNGLVIYSNGPVTLTRMYAEDNGNNGVTVNNSFGVGNVLLKGANTFLGNAVDGLSVYSKGSVTASYVIAYQNSQHGADIQNQNAPSAKGVAITGGGDFMGNSWGLSVNSKGSISLNRVNGSSNINYGMILHADGNATLTCSSAYGNNTAIHVRASNGTSPLPKLTLQGFISYGNTLGNTPNEDISADTVTRTSCPYP
jgi:hypothetical protein